MSDAEHAGWAVLTSGFLLGPWVERDDAVSAARAIRVLPTALVEVRYAPNPDPLPLDTNVA